jgi:hexosaminidase
MWAEYMEYPSKVEYMLFPRITALSEVLWSPKEKRDWKDFQRRLPVIFERLDKQKVNYSKAYYDLKATIIPTPDYNGVLYKVETTTKNYKIQYIPSLLSSAMFTYEKPLLIRESINGMNVSLIVDGKTVSSVTQSFSFNKATGKKITLTTQPSKSYPGDGAFTLVNGVQNEKGMSKTSEFLGFNGTDLEATIDLGSLTDISKVTLHVLDQNGSWIYLPSQVEVTYVPDVDYTEEQLKTFPKEIKKIDPIADKGAKTIAIESKQKARYIKVFAKNYGIIPSGNAGAGNSAWLFVDEIEVQ